MQTVILKVDGMSCSHCERAVKNAVGALGGVKSVTVSLKDKTVTVEHDPAQSSVEAVKAAIIEEGYEVA